MACIGADRRASECGWQSQAIGTVKPRGEEALWAGGCGEVVGEVLDAIVDDGSAGV